MLLKILEAGDLAQVADLINGAYRGEGGRTGWTHEGHLVAGNRTTAAELAADLAANPQALILGARHEADGPVLGSVWLNPAGGDAWYLGLLAVGIDGQGRGIGRQLLAAAEALVAARGARRMRLTVIHLRDDLIGWYERRGYGRTGASEPFPAEYTTLQDGLQLMHMDKAL
ncbi:MAG: family N-acetyltransferase [Caulobacter sp.]|nr:family N-acetyltransferase [Caulobacter sp.]